MNSMLRSIVITSLALALASGCSAGTMNTGDGGNQNGGDGTNGGDSTMRGDSYGVPDVHYDTSYRDVQPNPDAFFAMDPPPMMCLADGAVVTDAMVPGGTPECPDDKHREGCPCPYDWSLESSPMHTAPCWPGLRVNRNHGICMDGVTTCMPYDEMGGVWGPCVGAVLPTPGATTGAQACECFSSGQWHIDSLEPCLITYGSQTYAVSTYVDSSGMVQCPNLPAGAMPPFMPMAGQPFSTDTLQIDCSGQYHLCYTIRAGDPMHPNPATDCVVGQSCVDVWYETPGTTQTLPPLPGWSGTDAACAQRFVDNGGYGEMSVRGLSGACEHVDDGMGGPYIFHRITYCPSICNTNPSAAGCSMCGNGGTGMF